MWIFDVGNNKSEVSISYRFDSMILNKNFHNIFSSTLTGTEYNIPFLIDQPGTGKKNTI